MASRLHVHIAGLVQGVGYRHATYMKARAEALTGWVKNLPDHRVEALFEGPPATLKAMLEWCHQGPGLAQVQKVDATWEDSPPEFLTFEIRF